MADGSWIAARASLPLFTPRQVWHLVRLRARWRPDGSHDDTPELRRWRFWRLMARRGVIDG